MENEVRVRDLFLNPGYVCVPPEPARLAVVAASGVAVTLYDPDNRRGGMGHYIRPIREAGFSTAMFAAPSIVTLAQMMFAAGSVPSGIEAHLYGGASNSEADGFAPELAEENVRVGEELLARMGISLAGKDVGGTRARKIIFHTATGETVVAKVERVRSSDWYPDFRRTQGGNGGNPS